MTQELNYNELENEVGNKRVIVFGGFSGLGYESPEGLNAAVKDRIELEMKQYGKDNVVVVAGATSDGIGACYKVAKELGVPTYGIVSEAGKKYGSDEYCDKTVFTPDPNGTWQVLNEKGQSYMVDIAKNNGTLVYFGGGDVAVSEIKEAFDRKIQFETDISFEPNPAQIAKKNAQMAEKGKPPVDPTPLKTFILNNNLGIKVKLNGDIDYENMSGKPNVSGALDNLQKIRESSLKSDTVSLDSKPNP